MSERERGGELLADFLDHVGLCAFCRAHTDTCRDGFTRFGELCEGGQALVDAWMAAGELK